MKNITQPLKIIALAGVLSFGVSLVYAWAGPTVAPTGGNVDAPINTSATPQLKVGPLEIGGIFRADSDVYFDHGDIRSGKTIYKDASGNVIIQTGL